MKTRAALDGSGPLTADPTRPGRRRAVAKLVMATVVVGVAAAGAALPVIGGVGLTVRAAADGFNALPADLEEPPLPQRSVILGGRRHQARRVLPLQPGPGRSQAGRAHRPQGRPGRRGPALLCAARPGLAGSGAGVEQDGRGRGAGRVDADPAVRQERAAPGGADRRRASGSYEGDARPQAARAAAGAGAGAPLQQRRDLHPVSQHRLLRRRRLRHRGSRTALLRRLGEEAAGGSGRHPRRRAEEPVGA